MSATEFSLGLFGLLLGFILVEVLSGLMRTPGHGYQTVRTAMWKLTSVG